MQTVAANPWFISEFHLFIRLALAVVLGGLIGLEREQSNHAAGLRTNILVCLGSCLLMLLSIYGFSSFVDQPHVQVDPARLAAAVITGVGFLGAGTILFTGKAITGLTTAASLWVVSAIGLATGAGFYFASISVTVMVWLVLYAFNKLEKKYIVSRSEKLLVIRMDDRSAVLGSINTLLNERQIVIKKMVIEENGETGGYGQIVLHFYVRFPKSESPLLLLDSLKNLEGVHLVSSE